MTARFAAPDAAALPLHLIAQDDLNGWLADQPPAIAAWVVGNGFTAARGQALRVPGPDGAPALALGGYGTAKSRARKRFALAAVAETLGQGTYALVSDLPPEELEVEALGWLLAAYRFTRYRPAKGAAAELVAPATLTEETCRRIEIIAAAEYLTRNLINTPAADMGPAELESACRALADHGGARIEVTTGDALLEANFPMIHAVGRAASRSPRLIDLRWGDRGPAVTLVGKGVCFDTGGLDLKSAAGMGLMKKDMGGAATVLGLARMIIDLNLPLRLRVLIPAVENAVGGNAFRPGDILTSRKGLTVEINNTDAEGRLVLADALALACEEPCDLLVSMATLTGAARVAVGPDLAPFFTDDDADAAAVMAGAAQAADPAWRLPFHPPYEADIEPALADLDNAPGGGFGGAITAALFLRRFVDGPRYMHFDIYGWQPSAAPGRPKGGVGMGARALLAALPNLVAL